MLSSNFTGRPTYNYSLKRALSNNLQGALASIVLVFTQLHRSGFNSGFDTLFEATWRVVLDLRERKGKISGCFKYKTLVLSNNIEIK